MPVVKPVAGRVQIEVERLDGGLNSQFSPNTLDLSESPDCLNVVFGQEGSVETRLGCQFVSTTPIGSSPVVGGVSYNGSNIVWSNGSMYYQSGTTFVPVASSVSQFVTGAVVAHVVYQNMLICSDGTNGPYRYHGPDSFYQLGIAVPSAPTAASNTPGAAYVPTGDWIYKVSYVNTGVVEGEAGSAAVTLTLTNTAQVYVSSIPIAAASLGVASRVIYRASVPTGPFRYVGMLADNVTSVFTDSIGPTTWAVGGEPPDDASPPTPFTTAYQHKERVFFDDSSNRSLLRYTDYTVPYISQAENFFYLSNQDGDNIIAVNVQQDLVTAFKDAAFYLLYMPDPALDLTWLIERGPGNIGIAASRALCQVPDGLLFVGKIAQKISGVHLLSGASVLETSARVMKTNAISERIKDDLRQLPAGYFSNMCMVNYQNQILLANTDTGDTVNKYILWFDADRLQSSDNQPGSWSVWDGRGAEMSSLWVHGGNLYGGSSLGDGLVFRLFYPDLYNDVYGEGTDTDPINSYWWSKPIGGGSVTGYEESIDSWIKDWRFITIWYDLLGGWDMLVNYKTDGDTSDGLSFHVDLNPGGALWAVMKWGIDTWGGGYIDKETTHPLGPTGGRRIQIRFSNENTAGRAFRVKNMKLLANLRRQK